MLYYVMYHDKMYSDETLIKKHFHTFYTCAWKFADGPKPFVLLAFYHLSYCTE